MTARRCPISSTNVQACTATARWWRSTPRDPRPEAHPRARAHHPGRLGPPRTGTDGAATRGAGRVGGLRPRHRLRRVREFIDGADDRIVLMAIDDLPPTTSSSPFTTPRRSATSMSSSLASPWHRRTASANRPRRRALRVAPIRTPVPVFTSQAPVPSSSRRASPIVAHSPRRPAWSRTCVRESFRGGEFPGTCSRPRCSIRRL